MPMYGLSIIEKKNPLKFATLNLCINEGTRKKKVVGIPISNDYSFVVGVSEFVVSEEKKMKHVHYVFK